MGACLILIRRLVRGVVRSRRSTRRGSWLSTTRSRRGVAGVRCCVVRACIARISRSGARPVTRRRWAGSRPGRGVRSEARSSSSWNGSGSERRGPRPSWNARGSHWRFREKHTRSRRCSPRARTPRRGRSRDRRAHRRSCGGDVDGTGVWAVGPVVCDPSSPSVSAGVGSASAAADATERVERG